MIIVMEPDTDMGAISKVLKTIETNGFKPHLSKGEETTVIGVIGDERKLNPDIFSTMEGVDRIVPVVKSFKLASREFQKTDTQVKVKSVTIGKGSFTVIAGPCAVESLEQTVTTARHVRKEGAVIPRGGAFKPRTSPYSFQGLGKKGLEILAQARTETGLPVVTEVTSVEDVPDVAHYADILQIGARNMQNFNLLDTVGKQEKPVLLKRGMSSTIEEMLLSAEYILSRGNPNVILCERGIRTFEKATRNTLDISAVPVIKKLSHLPILIDPSHASGVREYVSDLARAAIAVGADGVIIEVHPEPEKALCDGPESLPPPQFQALMKSLDPLATAMGVTLNR